MISEHFADNNTRIQTAKRLLTRTQGTSRGISLQSGIKQRTKAGKDFAAMMSLEPIASLINQLDAIYDEAAETSETFPHASKIRHLIEGLNKQCTEDQIRTIELMTGWDLNIESALGVDWADYSRQ